MSACESSSQRCIDTSISCWEIALTYRELTGSHSILEALPDIAEPIPVEIEELVEDAAVDAREGATLLFASSVRWRTDRVESTA